MCDEQKKALKVIFVPDTVLYLYLNNINQDLKKGVRLSG